MKKHKARYSCRKKPIRENWGPILFILSCSVLLVACLVFLIFPYFEDVIRKRWSPLSGPAVVSLKTSIALVAALLPLWLIVPLKKWGKIK